MDSEQPPSGNAAAFGDPSHLPHGEENLTPFAQLKRMQRVLYSAVVDPDSDPRMRAQAATAWERLELRKSVMQMKPAPKPVDVAELQRAKDRRKAARDAEAAPTWRKRRAQAQDVHEAKPTAFIVVSASGQPITQEQIDGGQ